MCAAVCDRKRGGGSDFSYHPADLLLSKNEKQCTVILERERVRNKRRTLSERKHFTFLFQEAKVFFVKLNGRKGRDTTL